jgi:hypothetical protein
VILQFLNHGVLCSQLPVLRLQLVALLEAGRLLNRDGRTVTADLETKLMGAVQLRTTETLEALVSWRFGFSLMVEGRDPEVLSRSEWLRLTNAHARLEGFEIRSVAAGPPATTRSSACRWREGVPSAPGT